MLDLTFGIDAMGGERVHADGALGDDLLLEVLKCGGLHAVITEVASVGDGAEKERVLMLFSVWVGN